MLVFTSATCQGYNSENIKGSIIGGKTEHELKDQKAQKMEQSKIFCIKLGHLRMMTQTKNNKLWKLMVAEIASYGKMFIQHTMLKL